MPTCGALRIGNEIHVPAAPGLVIVNVPPARSSGPSCRARARAATSRRHSRGTVRRMPSALARRAPRGPRWSRSTAIPRFTLRWTTTPSPSTEALRSGNSRSASITAGDEGQRGESCFRADPLDLGVVGRELRSGRAARAPWMPAERVAARSRTLLNGTTSSRSGALAAARARRTAGDRKSRVCRGARRRHGNGSLPASDERCVLVTAHEGIARTPRREREREVAICA